MGYIRLLFLLAIIGMTTARSKPKPQFPGYDFPVAGGVYLPFIDPDDIDPNEQCKKQTFGGGCCVEAGTCTSPDVGTKYGSCGNGLDCCLTDVKNNCK